MSTKTLVAKVFGTAPAGPCIPHGATTTQVASVARAVRSLARKGLVVTSPSNAAHRRRQVRAYPPATRGAVGRHIALGPVAHHRAGSAKPSPTRS
jgi:hypothetical protein